MNKKIGIIHSNNLFKYGLKLLLGEKSYEVNTQVYLPLKERFDVLFIEYNQLSDGLRQIQAIKALYPYCKVLILVDRIDDDGLKSLVSLDINGIITQDLNEDFILQMFDFVYNNGFVLSGEVFKMLKKTDFMATSPIKMTRNQFKSYHSNLTQREYEVLKLLVEGKSNMQIAQTLTISEHTAKAHVCNIIQKLVVDDRTQAVIKAIKEGIV